MSQDSRESLKLHQVGLVSTKCPEKCVKNNQNGGLYKRLQQRWMGKVHHEITAKKNICNLFICFYFRNDSRKVSYMASQKQTFQK